MNANKKIIKNVRLLKELASEIEELAAKPAPVFPNTGAPLAMNPSPGELKNWRADRGYTQQTLADRLGVQVAAVTRWEAAQRPLTAYFWLALAGIDALDKQIGMEGE